MHIKALAEQDEILWRKRSINRTKRRWRGDVDTDEYKREEKEDGTDEFKVVEEEYVVEVDTKLDAYIREE